MAKSVKKKANRRLKRSVRRTFGALCMMTAIIVAAIPFPDAAADDGSVAQSGSSLPYSYGEVPAGSGNQIDDVVFDDTTDDKNVQMDFKAKQNGTAYTISNISGDWQMDWQFKYYAEGPGEDGYITEYNNQYQVDEIELQYRVFSDYISISTEGYSNYGTSTDEKTNVAVKAGTTEVGTYQVNTLSHEYVLNADDSDGDGVSDGACYVTNAEGAIVDIDLTKCKDYKFYTDDKNGLKEDYETYKKAYKEYLDLEIKGPKPEPLSRTYRDVYTTDVGQVQFLCDQIFGTGTPMSLKFVDERVYDDESGKATGWEKIYVPCLTNKPAEGTTITIGTSTYYFDSNGFLANKFNTISGIAKEAFKGVGNVKTLKMAEQISFIGNSAFEDSFIQAVELPMDSVIGNRAFKNCGRLTNVSIPVGVQEIGAEAFYGTSLSAVTIPDTINEIGDGAFANCGQLQTVTFEGNSFTEKSVGDFAFYDCLNLNRMDFGEAQVVSLGDCAFATSRVVGGGMTNFEFPHFITDAAKIGKYLFGNRTNLSTVTMPKNLGTSITSNLDGSIFYGCNNLSCVNFPESCVSVSYSPDMFKDVVNSKFYVRGPKTNPGGNMATEPRKSTWEATYNNGERVPYVYTEDGNDYYEISDGVYVSVIDQSGILSSCQFADGVDSTGIKIGSVADDGTVTDPFVIPANVGTTTVVGMKEDCFDGTEGILDHIVALKIADGSQITNINNGVFSEAALLEYVYIGDSVQTIGNDAFSKCPNLERVEIGSGVTAIGDSAFENSNQLTEISFKNPIGGEGSFPLSNIGVNAFSTNGDKLTIYGLIHGSYGPFAWAMQPDNYMDKTTGVRVCYQSAKEDPQGMTVILDNSNNLPTLVDYPKYNDSYDDPNGQKDTIADIFEAVEKGETITPQESAIMNAVTNIVVPDGVKSIDSKGYFASDSKIMGEKPAFPSNSSNIVAYFNDIDSNVEKENRDGLFNSADSIYSNLTDEYPDGSKYETVPAGNDRIESVILTSVEYLPEDAFYSCERLETINLGSALNSMDDSPFRGCLNLSSVAGGNGKYSCNNGILYENLTDGTKKIVECLPSRGGVVGSSTISLDNDPDLSMVTEIGEKAFSECPNINKADFTGVSNFDEIPDECFIDSKSLIEVDLPENVISIGERAFATGGDFIEVIVRGHEVSLGKNAFENVKNPYLISYEDSGVRRNAKKQGANVDETLDEMLTVKFYRSDNGSLSLIKTIFVEPNSNAKKEAPDEEEMAKYLAEGEKLYGWIGENGADLKNIIESCFFTAQIGLENGIDTDGDGIPDTPITDNPDNSDNPGGTTGDTDNPGGTTGDTDNPGGTTGDTDNLGGTTGDTDNPGGTTGDTDNPGGTTGTTDTNKNDNDDDNDDDDDNDSSSDTVKKYTLSVVYGDGSGVYASGTKVIISAIEPPAGKEFYMWTSNNTGVTITSATSAATTVKTTNSDAVITATYRDKNSSVSANTVTRKPIGSSGNSGTSVQITKPGISNTDKAYASVSGSTDNFIVKITESSAAANAVATALSNEYADMNPIKYFAMDISLYDKNGNIITNTNGLSVNVTMPIPDALVQYGGNNKVGAVVNGNVLEKLNCKFTTVSGVPCVTFTATHFSPYTIYVDTSNLSVNTLDSTPKTGDGIHPKWFFSLGLACISVLLFMKKDKATPYKTIVS